MIMEFVYDVLNHLAGQNETYSQREVQIELVKAIRANFSEEGRVILVTKHKDGMMWVQTVITDSCTYHFRDYDHYCDAQKAIA